jgi:hypothetical protein
VKKAFQCWIVLYHATKYLSLDYLHCESPTWPLFIRGMYVVENKLPRILALRYYRTPLDFITSCDTVTVEVGLLSTVLPLGTSDRSDGRPHQTKARP